MQISVGNRVDYIFRRGNYVVSLPLVSLRTRVSNNPSQSSRATPSKLTATTDMFKLRQNAPDLLGVLARPMVLAAISTSLRSVYHTYIGMVPSTRANVIMVCYEKPEAHRKRIVDLHDRCERANKAQMVNRKSEASVRLRGSPSLGQYGYCRAKPVPEAER